VSFFFLFLAVVVLESYKKKGKNISPGDTRLIFSRKKNQHTLPYPYSVSFLYSNPCFSLSLSLSLFFFTIFTDNTLKRSFVFKKQTKIHFFSIISVFQIIMSNENDVQTLSNRLNALTTDELHAFDLQLTLIRTAFESYKRETVFKPCPPFLVGLDDDQIVSIRYSCLFDW
jgi:hypothetical protein